jgi:hypothetical protein
LSSYLIYQVLRVSKFAEHCTSSANSYINKKFHISLFSTRLSSSLPASFSQSPFNTGSCYKEAKVNEKISSVQVRRCHDSHRAISGQGDPIGTRTGRDIEGGDLSAADTAGEEDGAGEVEGAELRHFSRQAKVAKAEGLDKNVPSSSRIVAVVRELMVVDLS